MILSKHHSTVQSVYTNSLAISSNNCSKLGMSNERKFLSNDTHTSLLHKLQRLSWSIIRWGMACVEIIQISIWGTEKIVCWAAIYCGRIWTIVFDCLLFLTHAFFTPGASLCMLLIDDIEQAVASGGWYEHKALKQSRSAPDSAQSYHCVCAVWSLPV